MDRVKAAILGPGNIGTDLMYKVLRSRYLKLELMAGIVDSPGIERARSLGVKATTAGILRVLDDKEIRIVFDSTGAKPHMVHAPMLRDAGKTAIDLTPAAIGPYVVPSVNLGLLADAPNLNMVTCGGQATAPIVHAINRVARVRYAEIVACIASSSAGPGTRQNIDEFTQTTARALCVIGGANEGKAIIVLNPAEPPLIMTDTVYAEVENVDEREIRESIEAMISTVQKYVPGYRLRVPPQFDDHRVTTIIEVEGAGDFLPRYAGNLDIMTAAATAVGEELAARMLGMR